MLSGLFIESGYNINVVQWRCIHLINIKWYFSTYTHILVGESKYSVKRGGYDLCKLRHSTNLFIVGSRMVIHFYSSSKYVLLIVS